MEPEHEGAVRKKKSQRAIDREHNTAVYLLRCKQIGLSVADMDLLSMGMINDVFIEESNDEYDYAEIATQEDIARL